MREVNLLPAWYPKVVRQKKLLTAQAWLTAAVVLTGLVGLYSAQLTAAAARADLDAAQVLTAQTIKEVRELDQMLELQRQLIGKQAIVGELGLPVELSRVIAEMGACTPREVTFTQVEARTVEHAPQTIAERAALAVSGKTNFVSRQIELRLRGIAPTEAEVTAFWSRLIQRPFMTQVRLVNSNEKVDGEHKMREFEITLNIALNPPEVP